MEIVIRIREKRSLAIRARKMRACALAIRRARATAALLSNLIFRYVKIY